MIIDKTTLTDEIKHRIIDGFGQHALLVTGMNGFSKELIAFNAYENDEYIGSVVVSLSWGNLHIRYLFVEESYRKKGIGKMLLSKALDFGRENNCNIAFVETMNFQAPDFYKKFGFENEYTRTGFAQNVSFHYFRKLL